MELRKNECSTECSTIDGDNRSYTDTNIITLILKSSTQPSGPFWPGGGCVRTHRTPGYWSDLAELQ